MNRTLSRWALVALAALLFTGAALAAPVPAAPQADAIACLAAAAPVTSAAVAQPAAPVWLAEGKCATCSELIKACKAFCGSNNVTFSCQNSNPCAGTCTCTVPPA